VAAIAVYAASVAVSAVLAFLLPIETKGRSSDALRTTTA